ncbi:MULTISPECIES: ATP-binding cassette domain-containing protein [Streptomyces violaceusniger group]|uniref:ABC transporter domain-containing protein n=1 Tax=Streptomyces rhizosphaericus TaxID=114699 RepID=A0ABP4D981_9ACTN|nr:MULTISPECIES: ATP-binding cassette domain-containing protein [Streptomyces violaceusniger group]
MNTDADTTSRPAASAAAAGAAHVEASGVVRAFGPVQALGPVDLRIRAGEFVSVVGPSGCGKSTLLEIIGGLQAPDAGTVEVGGETLAGPRERTAIVFQDSACLPWRTVLDNVAFPLEVAKVPRKERRARAQELRVLPMVGWPAVMPAVAAGLRLTFGFTFLGLIIAEMFAGSSGLGQQLLRNVALARMEYIAEEIVLIVVLALVPFLLLTWIERRVNDRFGSRSAPRGSRS